MLAESFKNALGDVHYWKTGGFQLKSLQDVKFFQRENEILQKLHLQTCNSFYLKWYSAIFQNSAEGCFWRGIDDDVIRNDSIVSTGYYYHNQLGFF